MFVVEMSKDYKGWQIIYFRTGRGAAMHCLDFLKQVRENEKRTDRKYRMCYRPELKRNRRKSPCSLNAML